MKRRYGLNGLNQHSSTWIPDVYHGGYKMKQPEGFAKERGRERAIQGSRMRHMKVTLPTVKSFEDENKCD